jgi:two-component system LytT family response regulator
MTAKIRTVVVDDEPVARARVLSLLSKEEDIEVVGEYADGSEAVSAIRESSPDLLFLDIQMAGMTGFELADALGPQRMPAVVFVTAYDEYALRAFEIHALDYLLKPFSAERFRSALNHAREHLTNHGGTGADSRTPPPDARPAAQVQPPRERLVIRSSGRIYFIPIADIDWCEAAGNYVKLHVGQQSHFVRQTMGHLEAELGSSRFARIHRCTIVNIHRIEELRSSFNGEYIIALKGGATLTLSRGYREALQTRLGKAF